MTHINELKYCPKCKRLMVDETIRSAGGYIIRWHCLCGHMEEEVRKK